MILCVCVNVRECVRVYVCVCVCVHVQECMCVHIHTYTWTKGPARGGNINKQFCEECECEKQYWLFRQTKGDVQRENDDTRLQSVQNKCMSKHLITKSLSFTSPSNGSCHLQTRAHQRNLRPNRTTWARLGGDRK